MTLLSVIQFITGMLYATPFALSLFLFIQLQRFPVSTSVNGSQDKQA